MLDYSVGVVLDYCPFGVLLEYVSVSFVFYSYFYFFCNGNFHCVRLSRCKVTCKGDVVMVVTCLEAQTTMVKCGDSVTSFSLLYLLSQVTGWIS